MMLGFGRGPGVEVVVLMLPVSVVVVAAYLAPGLAGDSWVGAGFA